MKIFSFLSLRQWLTLPFVVLVLSLTLLIALLSYRTGSQAVQTVSNHLLIEAVGRIRQAVDAHMKGSAAALEVGFPKGLAAPRNLSENLGALQARFWTATAIHRDPSHYVYYGNQLGQFYGVNRLSDDEIEVRTKLLPNEPRRFTRIKGMNGVAIEDRVETKAYDPRLRPWYTAAADQVDDFWSDIYVDFTTSKLVATRARRVFDADGNFAGVVATDLSMSSLNEFVKTLSLSPNGVALIFEPNGKLIATSRGSNTAKSRDGQNVRVNTFESDEPIQRAAFAEIRRHLDAGLSINQAINQRFEMPDGATIELAFERMREGGHLNWIIAVAAPQSDFVEGVTSNIIRSVLLGLVAAALAVAIGLVVLAWVSRDLSRLTQAAHAVGQGQLEVPLEIHRNDEIGVLANAFRLMQQRLRTDQLTGLVNRDMFLRTLNARIQSARRAADQKPFALLFVDINNFKAINDRLGHEAGDKALVEIASRLRTAIRATDLAARYAGDEFVILLDGVGSLETAETIRRHVEIALEPPLKTLTAVAEPNGLFTTGAVGLAMYPRQAEDSGLLLKIADEDMYERKRRTQKVLVAQGC